jgi:hypothetical protein
LLRVPSKCAFERCDLIGLPPQCQFASAAAPGHLVGARPTRTTCWSSVHVRVALSCQVCVASPGSSPSSRPEPRPTQTSLVSAADQAAPMEASPRLRKYAREGLAPGVGGVDLLESPQWMSQSSTAHPQHEVSNPAPVAGHLPASCASGPRPPANQPEHASTTALPRPRFPARATPVPGRALSLHVAVALCQARPHQRSPSSLAAPPAAL